MKRIKFLLIVAIVAVIVSVNAISFAYWRAGSEGDQKDRDLDISIGEGNSYTTTISIGVASSTNSNLALIPKNRTPATGQTTSITFKMNVTWAFDYSGISTPEIGQFTATCSSIMIGEAEMLNVLGAGGLTLFEISIVKPSTLTTGDTAKEVTVTITMNEPTDRAQYNQIAGKPVVLTIDFLVLTDDDLNQTH